VASTLERVVKVTAEVLNIKPDGIKPESAFVADLGAESIQSLELVAGFEEEFDVELDEDEAVTVQTVGEAVVFIEKAINEQS